MWSPTHIQVTVQRAKDLLTKGKNGTNNCFVTIALGKEKYQTSVKEKSETNVSWNEECELKIPDQGNRAELTLTCLHHNNLGIDEFLGQATLPLNEMDVYDRPRSKWFKLQSKPGKEKKNKERGELEVRISFIVKSGSLTDLSKKEKHKSSVGQLATSVGGSLLSIGTIEKRKSIKKFAKSLGSKMHLHSKKKNKDGDDLSFNGSFASIDISSGLQGGNQRYGQRAGEADPGVISEDEDEFVFDNLSHKSSGSSLNVRTSNNGLQVPQKNYVPRNPSPLLSVADNQTFKGNDIMEETEYYNDQEVNLYEQQANELEEATLQLPPPSNEHKQSFKNETLIADKTINDWDLKPYNQKPESPKRNAFPSMYTPEAVVSQSADTTAEGNEFKDYENEVNSNVQSNGGTVTKPKFQTEAKPTAQTEGKPTAQTDSFKNINLNSSQFEVPLAVHYENEEQELNEENNTKIENDKNKNKNKTKNTNNPSMQDIDNGKKTKKYNEWESKLYLDINKSDSLKRNSWQTGRVQLPIVDAESPKTESQRFSALFEPIKSKDDEQEDYGDDVDDESDESEFEYFTHAKNESTNNKFEINQNFIKNETSAELEPKSKSIPKPKPRNVPNIYEAPLKEQNENAFEKTKLSEQEQKTALENMKMHLGYNKTYINENVQDVQNDAVGEMHNAKKLNDECNEEDRRILNFINDTKMKESSSMIEQSLRTNADKREKRLGKLKTFNEGGKQQNNSPRSNERIIIGHEMKSMSHAERRSEMTEALTKKYDGKSREELMLIANGMENEVLIYRQRVKELEDYLDNLLLRVMETHPKILQNPYSRTKSTKSG